MAGRVISARLCIFAIDAGRTVTSSAVHCPCCTRGRSHGTDATRSVSTEPCSARFPRHSPGPSGGVRRYGAVIHLRIAPQGGQSINRRTGKLGQPGQILRQSPKTVWNGQIDRILCTSSGKVQRPVDRTAGAADRAARLDELGDGQADELAAARAGLRAGHAGDDLALPLNALPRYARQLVADWAIYRINACLLLLSVSRQRAGRFRRPLTVCHPVRSDCLMTCGRDHAMPRGQRP
jgi:hypothetical protein